MNAMPPKTPPARRRSSMAWCVPALAESDARLGGCSNFNGENSTWHGRNLEAVGEARLEL